MMEWRAYACESLVSYADVARFINEHGVTNCKGKPVRFTGCKVKDLLKSSWYHAGFVQLPKRDVSRRLGKHKAIISAEILENIELRLQGGKIRKYRKNMNEHFPLKGHVACSGCGEKMRASYSNRNDTYGYYCCRNKSCDMNCRHIPHRTMHEQFSRLMKSITPNEGVADRAAAILKEVWKEECDAFMRERQSWGIEASKLEEKIEACVQELINTREEQIKVALKKQIEKFTRRHEVLKKKITDYSEVRDDFGTILEQVLQVVRRPHEIWAKANLQLKQALQRLVFPKTLLYAPNERKFRNAESGGVYRLFEKRSLENEGMVV